MINHLTAVDEYGRSLNADHARGSAGAYLFVHWCSSCKNSLFIEESETIYCDCGNERVLAKEEKVKKPVTSKYKIVYTKECPQCNRVYQSKRKQQRFCSSGCSARFLWNEKHPS